MLPGPCWCSMLGSSVWGGPYPVGCEVGRTPPLKPDDVVEAGLAACTSRRWTGSELLLMYCRLPMPLSSTPGDMERLRCAGEGVEMGDPWLDVWSPSDRGRDRAAAALAPLAKASAVALAASSMVPVWWF